MTEFKGKTRAARQGSQEFSKQFQVAFKVRRHLEQNRSKFLSGCEWIEVREEIPDDRRAITKLAEVGNGLVSFESEAETGRRLRQPVLRGFFREAMSKSVVDLNRIQPARVVAQELRLSQLL